MFSVASPVLGQAPSVNKVTGVSGTKLYYLFYSTANRGGGNINWLLRLQWTDATVVTANSVFVASTYAEVQTEAIGLGITNLPADPALTS